VIKSKRPLKKQTPQTGCEDREKSEKKASKTARKKQEGPMKINDPPGG
jgi:hypothetical protein